MVHKDNRPGFRTEFICPSCQGNDFGYMYRDNLNILYCFECHCTWTVHRKIEDVEDPQERV